MTHPGQQLVVPPGIYLKRAAAEPLDKGAKLCRRCRGPRFRHEGGGRREQPDRTAEQVPILHARRRLALCPPSGVPAERPPAGSVVVLHRSLGDLLLRATYICHQLVWA